MEVTFSDGSREQFEDSAMARGAQGEIYRSRDRRSVVKLLNQDSATPERARQIDAIINQYNATGNDPYWDELFAWPKKRAVGPQMGVSSRYITGLTRLDYFFFPYHFNHLPPDQRGWWVGRIAVAIKLARAVDRLSTKGLCHSDLSEKNIFVDAFAGRMTLLDCDSIVVPGVLPADVYGTPEYMAPELAMHKVNEPSVVTDRHALAVILYRWLLYRHPLLGIKRHSDNADRDEELALGGEALFIEHPTDTSNRPHRMQVTADTLTRRVRDLFHRAFVDGLHTPTLRPTANLWEDALIELMDRTLPCPNPHCQQQFFVAPEMGPLRCALCQTTVDFPGKLPFLKLRAPTGVGGANSQPSAAQYGDEYAYKGMRYARYIAGWPERPLYSWHLAPASASTIGPTGQRPDTAPKAMIRFDGATCAWYLENLAVQGMQVRINEHAPWLPVPVGARTPLNGAMQVLLGPYNVARMATVEMRSPQ